MSSICRCLPYVIFSCFSFLPISVSGETIVNVEFPDARQKPAAMLAVRDEILKHNALSVERKTHIMQLPDVATEANVLPLKSHNQQLTALLVKKEEPAKGEMNGVR